MIMAFQRLPQVTVTGRLTKAPELRWTSSAIAVASFTVAASERKKNQETQEWEDGDKCFLRCTLWREEAENLAESDLQQGAEVTVTGDLFQREYESNGEKRQSTELKNVVVAPSISRGQQVQARKVQRQQGGGQQQGQSQGGGWQGNQGQQQQQGSWDQGGQQQPQNQGWQGQGGGGGQGGGWNQQGGQQGGGGWQNQGQQQNQQQGGGNAPVSGPWNGSAQNAANGFPDDPPF